MKKFHNSDPQYYTLAPANYHDYRDFLKDRFELIKSKNKKYSLGVCASKSGISKSQLQFIFQKKRHLSLDRMPPLAKALKMKSDEEYYTYLLVCLNSSKNEKVRGHFEDILNRLRGQHVHISLNKTEELVGDFKGLYSNYHLMILQALVNVKGFQEDPAWILEHLQIPGLSSQDIIRGLKTLEDSGAIMRDENGRLYFDGVKIWRPDAYEKDAFSVYTKAAEATAHLMQTPKAYRPSVYSSMALAFDETNLLAAEKYMIETHHHLCQLANQSKNSTAVVHVGNFLLTVLRL